jgi:hypothetical protein
VRDALPGRCGLRGDFMANASEGCTTGPPVINPNNGNQYYLSVAHCFGNSTGVYMHNDDYIDSRSRKFTNCAYLGQSSHIDDALGYGDALISGSTYSYLV